MKQTLTADYLSVFKWWVDVSYTIHDDCKGHTGAIITIGKGAVTRFSRKKRIQGKSYTEDELIVADDAIPQALWTK